MSNEPKIKRQEHYIFTYILEYANIRIYKNMDYIKCDLGHLSRVFICPALHAHRYFRLMFEYRRQWQSSKSKWINSHHLGSTLTNSRIRLAQRTSPNPLVPLSKWRSGKAYMREKVCVNIPVLYSWSKTTYSVTEYGALHYYWHLL